MEKLKFLSYWAAAFALVVGLSAKIFTKTNDHPIEQAAESVLRSHGIDLDFSPDEENDK